MSYLFNESFGEGIYKIYTSFGSTLLYHNYIWIIDKQNSFKMSEWLKIDEKESPDEFEDISIPFVVKWIL